jgi:hypothetical protein
MPSYEEIFEAFMRYVMPFILLVIGYEHLTRKPRTRRDLFWAILNLGIAGWGLVLLVGSLLRGSG